MIALTTSTQLGFSSQQQKRQAKLVRHPPGTHVYLFFDFSNIGISARYAASINGDGLIASDVRIHCQNLRQFVERDRFWAGGYAAAGLTGDPTRIQNRFDSAGIRFEVFERGNKTGCEQAVDQAIQNQMYRLVATEAKPGVVVLASGDGNGHENGEGFLPPLQLLKRNGFDVEVMSWEHSLHPSLGSWATQNGSLIYLDDWYEELTFAPYRRNAKSAALLNRRLARAFQS